MRVVLRVGRLKKEYECGVQGACVRKIAASAIFRHSSTIPILPKTHHPSPQLYPFFSKRDTGTRSVSFLEEAC